MILPFVVSSEIEYVPAGTPRISTRSPSFVSLTRYVKSSPVRVPFEVPSYETPFTSESLIPERTRYIISFQPPTFTTFISPVAGVEGVEGATVVTVGVPVEGASVTGADEPSPE